ncbi:hypothetical protein UFOVP456_13 [uncultured Caudovirales phage]|uniref:Uncharacterized protein n=1 Tax=uncultured Caudovirales phage TaxID=2100421 RepID=A0A6J5MDM0_9CAUD|nr:hypothetical protein UFOVP456_13 [uncultured Caudovirales phage]
MSDLDLMRELLRAWDSMKVEAVTSVLHRIRDRVTAPQYRICTWTYEHRDDFYSTTCQHAFVLNDGTPHSNNMVICCYCGGNLVERHLTEAGRLRMMKDAQ